VEKCESKAAAAADDDSMLLICRGYCSPLFPRNVVFSRDRS